MDDATEQAWLDGGRAVYLGLLRHALSGLGYDSPETKGAAWIIEREEAIAKLRSLCAEFGDNDWEPNLSLADIIDKHLGCHLEAD